MSRFDLPALARLSRREKLMLLGCAAAVAIFIVYMSGEAADPGVELADPRASVPSAAPVQTAAPMPVSPPPVASPPQVTAPPVAATTDPSALVLTGVFGGGAHMGSAVVILPTGQQRRVQIGREVMPGVRLKSVGVGHAVLEGPGGETRLELARGTASSVAGAPAM